MKSAAFDYEKNTETINSYDKQIDFFNNKDKDIQKSKREHDLKENQLKNDKGFKKPFMCKWFFK